MAIIDLITFGSMRLAVVDADPTSSGVSLPIGSLAAFNNSGVGEFFQKTGSSSTAWTLFATGNPNVSLATGTLAIANGGTGQTTYTDGQLLIGNSTGNTLAKSTLTAGNGISVTNGSGSITIASTADSTIAVNTVSTTDATATTIQTIATSSNQVQLVKIKVLGYRAGGSAGTAGDSATFDHTLRIKNIAGTVTIPDNQTNFYSADQSWTVAFTVSSTNVLVQVTGAVNNNVDWKSESTINVLS